MSSEARTPRLPDWGSRRMFPTAPLLERIAAKARRLSTTYQAGRTVRAEDDYYGWDVGDATVPMGIHRFCEQRGINPRDLYKRSLSEYIVDRISCRAGFHPSEVYEDWHSLADAVEVA